jgi:hypothetical protein
MVPQPKLLKRGGEVMKKLEVYSKKAGKVITVEMREGSCQEDSKNLGWVDGGWARFGAVVIS